MSTMLVGTGVAIAVVAVSSALVRLSRRVAAAAEKRAMQMPAFYARTIARTGVNREPSSRYVRAIDSAMVFAVL